uniref:Uncharacterized protein n=1 Tax=Candidatus Kentrum sp. DK TaxID=2126562 RepID=A0A450T3J1_9GAMM|nr:MAG: hypothetical protein BECKDK2373B_GA0170837_10967 [Candidatus Kentron sp. DK]
MSAGFGRVKQDAGGLPWQERGFPQDRSVVSPINYSPSLSWSRNKIAKNFPFNELICDDSSAFRPNFDPLADEIRKDQAFLVDSRKALEDAGKAEAKRRRAINAMEKLRGSGNGGLVEALLEERGRERTDSHESASTPRVFSGAERQRAIDAMEKLRGSGNGGLVEALLELRGRAAT